MQGLLTAVALPIFAFVASTTFLPHSSKAADWEKSHGPQAEQADANIEVLVAGASRTGTSSMQHALQRLGYHTIHWQGYMKDDRIFDFISFAYQDAISEPDLHKVFQDVPGKGALLDAVVPMLFDDLRRAYPSAKVILTTREPMSWLKSYENYVATCWLYHWSRYPFLWILSHVARALRLGKVLRLLQLLPKKRSGLDLDLLPELSEVYRKTLVHVEKRKVYEEHVKATVPKEQLLVFDASEGDTMGKLAMFLNLSVPDLESDTFPKLFDASAQEEKDGAVWFHNHPSATAVKAAVEANPEAKLWGGVAPELQELSNVTGCPLYFTPPKYWPKDLAQSYLSGKKVFGIVRNPLERLVAMFRGGYSEYGSFPPHFRESCDVNGAIRWLMQSLMNGTVSKYASQCTFIPQAEFFEGPFGVQIAVDNLHFPESLNRMLVYNDLGQAAVEQNVILQIAGCDNVWAGDVDEETKSLVYKYFQADFDLLCQRFGYCDKGTRNTCLVQVPGMCPPKNFTWHQTLKRYVALTKESKTK
eukprot:Skav233169  [mRNA]  locus=scaffold7441:11645:16873:+ [translate_table: standard]